MTLSIWERSAAIEAEAEQPREGPGRPSDPGRGQSAGGPGGSGRARGRRRTLWVMVAIIVVVLVGAAITVGVQRAAHRGMPLDPDNPGREGAQAVARVLSQRGLDVTVARGQDQLLGDLPPDPAVDASTTVVVTAMDQLSAETARTMLGRSRRVRRVVLVEPGSFVLTALGLPVSPAGEISPADGVRAACDLDGLTQDDTITPAGRTYRTQSGSATSCFPFDGAAQLVDLPATGARPEVVVLGAGAILRNSEVTRLDNAGVVLRLFGQGQRVTWYVPSALDITTEDTTTTSEVPEAIGPLILLGFLGLIVLMVWRGRRFGPLVDEPLPAVVKAIETTQSRGRLYRKARDTRRAGQALRSRACRRLGSYLGLPQGAAAAAVAQAAAAATNRDPVVVAALLAGPPVPTEGALLTLAHDLSQLEKEVRRA